MLNHADLGHTASAVYALQHDAAHGMGGVVLQLFPETKFAIGPPTADGFYYDFEIQAAADPR